MSDSVCNELRTIGEELEVGNFTAWKVRMQNFLLNKDLLDVVTEDEKPPGITEVERWEPWGNKSRQTVNYIAISVSKLDMKYMWHVQRADAAKEAWDMVHHSVTKSHRLQLRKQLYNLRKGKLSIKDYVLRIRKIATQLARIGASIDDEELLAIMFNGVGVEYGQFELRLTRKDKYPTFDEVVPLLSGEEARLKAMYD